MIIEQNTNYAYKLKYMENPTFDKVRDLAIKFMRELPKQLQDELYEALNRGVDILDSEPQMVTYLYAFGPMHQAKLNYAFKHLPEEFLEQPEINIIDYGCGQALGTMCYADFLRENGYSQKVKTITLIEPSEMCLKRAALHASVFFPDAEIKTVNKSFDELVENDICCDEDFLTLHILSNVLDILDFDLETFADLIEGQINGYNQFVCVGPYFNYSDKDDRMDDFCSLLNGDSYYDESFDKYEFDEDKAWTAQILCFSVGELEEGNYNKTCSSTVLSTLKGFKYSIKKHSSTYENTETPIIYLSLSKKFKGQDYLVLSKTSAENLLRYKNDWEQKEFLSTCQVVFSEEADCYGIIMPPTNEIIGVYIFNDNENNSEVAASTVQKKLYGYTLELRRSFLNCYEDSEIPIVYFSLSKEFNGQDYLVLSKSSAEAFLKCKDDKEQKMFLGNCRVIYSKEADCYGVVLPNRDKVLFQAHF